MHVSRPPPARSQDAFAFAASIGLEGGELEQAARNLATFPDTIQCRGVFFLGLSRLLEKKIGPSGVAEQFARANLDARTFAFKSYPHHDFYKLYYVTAKKLLPGRPFDQALGEIAKTFFPIFRESIV